MTFILNSKILVITDQNNTTVTVASVSFFFLFSFKVKKKHQVTDCLDIIYLGQKDLKQSKVESEKEEN